MRCVTLEPELLNASSGRCIPLRLLHAYLKFSDQKRSKRINCTIVKGKIILLFQIANMYSEKENERRDLRKVIFVHLRSKGLYMYENRFSEILEERKEAGY